MTIICILTRPMLAQFVHRLCVVSCQCQVNITPTKARCISARDVLTVLRFYGNAA